MRDIAQPQVDSIENLVKQFETAQNEAVARYDGLIQAARNLQHQRNLFEEVIMNSRDAVFMVEEESGIIRHVNQAAERLTGYTAEELRGRKQISLFPRELRTALKEEYGKLHQDGGISSLRTRVLRADGSEVDVSISVNALPDDYQGLTVGLPGTSPTR